MKQKRWLSLLLAAAMVFSAIPTALAGDEAPQSGYVLMNIPYEAFYEAELGESGAVDAVSSATLKYANSGVAGGSYHDVDASSAEAEVKALGVIYPVYVADLSALDSGLEIKATDTAVIHTVTGREKTINETEATGAELLFCAPSYSWCELSDTPALYKSLTFGADVAYTFGAVNGEAEAVEGVEAAASYHTHHGNYIEVKLGGLTVGESVSGMVVSFDDGSAVGLPHVQGVWQKTQFGWAAADEVAGKTVTGVKIITAEHIYTASLELPVKRDAGNVGGAFDTASTVVLSSLPEDMAGAVATVKTKVGRGETATVIAENAAVTDGVITTTEPAQAQQTYTVSVVSDNYADVSFDTFWGEGYVLMNIPYADFYEAELGDAAEPVDAVSSATKNKPRTGTLAGGSYHVSADGSDISGAIYPVKVNSADLAGLTQITDSSSVSITVTNRGTTSTTVYKGKDALFEAPDYAYYLLSSEPAVYKTLTADSGKKSFSAVSADAQTVEGASGAVNEEGHHAGVEIKLSGTEGIAQGQAVAGVIVTFSDGSRLGLRHVANLWRATELGGDRADFAGKTMSNVRYYTQDAVIDFPMTVEVKREAAGVSAAFDGAGSVRLTGLPDDIEAPTATVGVTVNRQTTYINADGADGTPVVGGAVATSAAEEGTVYTVTVKSANYLPIRATAAYKAQGGDHPDDADDAGDGELRYQTTVAAAAHGSVSVSPKSAASGTTVKITAAPDAGYEVDEVTVTAGGREVAVTGGGSAWSFTQPGRKATVIVTFKPVGEESAELPFVDVAEDAWYRDAVAYCFGQGYFRGTSDDLFTPGGAMSRAMFAAVLYRIAGEPAVTGVSAFADVPDGAWYHDAVLWAAENGVVEGYGDGRFGADDPVTREQIVTLFWRYRGRNAGTAALAAFADADKVSDWAAQAMSWAVGLGVIEGRPGGVLDPQGTATRAEVAQLVFNFGKTVK